MSSLTRLVEHSPLHWSSVLLRVCVQCSGPAQHIAGCQNSCPVPLPFPSPSPSPQQWLLAVLKEVTSTKRNPPGSIDSSVKFWVANSVTQPLCALLRTCVDVLSVAASVVLQPLVIPSPPLAECPWMPPLSRHTHWSSSWDRRPSLSGSLHTSCVCQVRDVVAKPRPSASPTPCRSLHPAVLVPCLLQALVSGRAAAGVGMFQVLEFASQTCGRSTVESSLVQLFQVCPSWQGTGQGRWPSPSLPGRTEGEGWGRHVCPERLLPPAPAAQPSHGPPGGTSAAQGL